MTEQPQRIASVFTGDLVVGDPTSLSLFANEPQSKLRFASRTIAEIATRSTENVERIIKQVLLEIGNIDKTQPQHLRRSFFSRGSERDQLAKKYQELFERINEMALALQLQQAVLIKENVQLKNLEPILKECCSSFEQHIRVATILSNKLSTGNIKAADSSLTEREIKEWQTRLERKLEDIRISHTISMQTVAQIKVLMENNRQVIDRIAAAVTNTIPIWRTQVVLSLNIERLKAEYLYQGEIASVLNSSANMARKDMKQRQNQAAPNYEKLRSINRELSTALSELTKIEKDDSDAKSGLELK